MTRTDALAELRDNGGTQFAPAVVAAFLTVCLELDAVPA
jgi:response regulator RpfG family c-di-GMP phosphodiesterase